MATSTHDGATRQAAATPSGIATVIERCRADIAVLRQEASAGALGLDGHAHPDGASPWQRVAELTARLDQAAAALEQTLDRASPMDGSGDTLAREADHRIKNHLQSLVATLSMQARHADTGTTRAALLAACGRVNAIAHLHTALHTAPSGSDGLVDIAVYLKDLCRTLSDLLAVDGTWRRLRDEIEPCLIPPDLARTLGQIVTELVVNAFRHGIPDDQPGLVSVTARRQTETLQLTVHDDGRGLPRSFDLRQRPNGLGLRLVNTLSDQAKARLTARTDNGAVFTLTIPCP